MNTFQSPIAAFCSYGTVNYEGFLTTPDRIQQDVLALLQEFGAGKEVRRDVYAALTDPNRVPYSSGFRYENGEGEYRTVVYGTTPISFLDDHKPTAHAAIDTRRKKAQEEKVRADRAAAIASEKMNEGGNNLTSSRATGAWCSLAIS